MRTPQPLPVSFGWTSLSKTWELFSKAKGKILGLALLSWLVTLGVGLIPGIGKIATGFFYPLILGGGIRVLAAIDRGENPSVEEFFVPISNSVLFKRYLPLAITCGAFMFAGAIMTRVLLLILGMNGATAQTLPPITIPGTAYTVPGATLLVLIGSLVTVLMSLVTAILCLYAPALIELEGATSQQGMEQSLALTTRNWLPLLILGFVFLIPPVVLWLPGFLVMFFSPLLGFAFLAVAALPVVGLVVSLSFCLPYVLYRETFRPPVGGAGTS